MKLRTFRREGDRPVAVKCERPVYGAFVEMAAADATTADGWKVIAFEVSMKSGVALTRKDFEQIVANFAAYPCAPVTIEHADTDFNPFAQPPREWREPNGHVEELRIGSMERAARDGTKRTVATLEARPSYLEPTATDVANKKWRYFSVTTLHNVTDEETGAKIGTLLWSLTLTAHPRLTGLPPVTASRRPAAGAGEGDVLTAGWWYGSIETRDDLVRCLREIFDLPVTSTEAEVLAELDKLEQLAAGEGDASGIDVDRIVSQLRDALRLPALSTTAEVLAEVRKGLATLPAAALEASAPLPRGVAMSAAAGPSYGVGDRVRVAGTPHAPGHGEGQVREAVLTYAYGLVIDGMEADGVHHWYVESELAPAPEAGADGGAAGAGAKKPPRGMEMSRPDRAPRGAAARTTTTETTMKFLELAARYGLPATSEEDAQAKVLAFLALGADALRALELAPGATPQELATKVKNLTEAAAKVPGLEASLQTYRDAEAEAETALRASWIGDMIEAKPELAVVKASLEADAERDWKGFQTRYPRPSREELVTAAAEKAQREQDPARTTPVTMSAGAPGTQGAPKDQAQKTGSQLALEIRGIYRQHGFDVSVADSLQMVERGETPDTARAALRQRQQQPAG